jgi:hypothetical protein
MAMLLVLILLVLLIAPAAQAEIKATSVVYAWDRTDLRFKNSNVTIWLDNGWVPFIHELGYDNDNYFSATTCPSPGTDYAGIMEFGLYHEDNSPPGGYGFQATRNWQLVYCDRDGDGNFDNDDLSAQPPFVAPPGTTDGFIPYNPEPLDPPLVVIPPEDEERTCSTGNCAFEIVTTMEVNLDDDCNGVIDTTEPICFYAEAQVPSREMLPLWEQQLQARVSAGGGDKTVNFNLRGPTAVRLLDFSARGASGLDMRLSLAALTLAAAALIGVILLRRGRPVR